jgi:two-component system, NarL family, response regulator
MSLALRAPAAVPCPHGEEREGLSAEVPIRIMLADDHLVFRFGLCAIIDRQPDMRVVAEAWSGPSAVAFYREHRPDVTLMDLRMPGELHAETGGLEAISAIRTLEPAARILVVTIQGGEMARRALERGAAACLIKDASYEDVLESIRTVVHRVPPPVVPSA